jgi:hypothetical protein
MGALAASAAFVLSATVFSFGPAEAAGSSGRRGAKPAAAQEKVVKQVVAPDMKAKGAVTAYSSSKATTTLEDPQTTSSIGPAEDANCMKSRKRLWVEDQGWVVRRVTTCF